MELSKAKVLITGGGRGIGNFIAGAILKKVAKVFIIDHNKELLNELLPLLGNHRLSPGS